LDRFEAMNLLVAAVDAGSFSAAGRKLGVPLPTVSRKIAELEAQLNTRLLVRSTRKLTLTEAGAAYLASAKQILELLADAERAAGGEYETPRGELVVTAPVAFGRLQVLPIVNDFLASFPDIQVRLLLSDHTLHLIDEHIDVAVRVGRLRDTTMVASQVGLLHRVVCASPAYLAARGTPLTPADLADHTCVTFERIVAGAPWSFAAKNGGLAPAPSIHTRLTVNTAEAAVDAAVAGVGVIQVLSYQAFPAVKAGRLKVLLRAFEPPPIPVSLIHVGQGLLPVKTRRFLDFAVPRLRVSIQEALDALDAAA
jgi:DNA-binding transcriptional LysR family regulator